MKKTLIVLCGLIGCGKTTLIYKIIESNPNFISADVYSYISKYKDLNGHVDPIYSLKAYNELYEDVSLLNEDLILELGTNRPELNLNNINNLKNKYNIVLVFCLLEKEICIQRVLDRADNNKKRIISREDLEEKMKRVFPDVHTKLANELNLKYILMDMGQPLDILLDTINKIIK